MFVKSHGSAVLGIDALPIAAEVNITAGIGMYLVGLPDNAVRESQERIRAAFENCSYKMSGKKVVVNLSPADIRKEGSAYDLTIALGILAATEQLPAERLSRYIVMGELSLDGSVLPGYVGFEAGQAAFGDIYAWFRRIMAWPLSRIAQGDETLEERILGELTAEAESLPLTTGDPVALDWHNGRRTPDADPRVHGAIDGLTLATSAPAVFKALVEATAFGSRAINERMLEEGVPIDNIIAIGGIARKSSFVMRTMADVMGMPIRVLDSDQACALGVAMFAAVAAGIHGSVAEAQQAMRPGFSAEYRPDMERHAIYDYLYARYLELGAAR